MSLTVQQLRTTIATQVPAGLEPGQIALNLANGWFIVGDGGNGVSVAGAPVAAGASYGRRRSGPAPTVGPWRWW